VGIEVRRFCWRDLRKFCHSLVDYILTTARPELAVTVGIKA
jgi:hypothetical protein